MSPNGRRSGDAGLAFPRYPASEATQDAQALWAFSRHLGSRVLGFQGRPAAFLTAPFLSGISTLHLASCRQLWPMTMPGPRHGAPGCPPGSHVPQACQVPQPSQVEPNVHAPEPLGPKASPSPSCSFLTREGHGLRAGRCRARPPNAGCRRLSRGFSAARMTKGRRDYSPSGENNRAAPPDGHGEALAGNRFSRGNRACGRGEQST